MVRSVRVPKIFDHSQPLLADKWATVIDGTTVLVRRRGDDGIWRPTKAGLQYYKSLRTEFVATVGSRVVHRDGIRLSESRPLTLSHEDFAIPFIADGAREFLTKAQLLAILRNRVHAYLAALPDVKIESHGIFKILSSDSGVVVWDGSRTDIIYSRRM
jgi:hypothetical protein